MHEYSIHSLADMLHKREQFSTVIENETPTFLLRGDTIHWSHLYDDLSRWQIAICDSDKNIIACGVTVPIHWNGKRDTLPSNLENIILAGLDCHESESNTLVPIGAYVTRARQGEGLSKVVLAAMKQLARDHHKRYMVIPLRPILKHHYPLHSIRDYASWQINNEAFDPWLRTHQRMGATILDTVESTVTVRGKVSQWEKLLDMALPAKGKYIIPYGLYPLDVSIEEDRGVYHDPNIWVQHPLD